MSTKTAEEPKTIYRKDYKVPSHLIPEVRLEFLLEEESSIVSCTLKIEKNKDSENQENKLLLNAMKMEILEVKVDGKEAKWTFEKEIVTISELPENFTLEIKNKIDPKNNKSLEGLYESAGLFCTQCEAEGFRGITPFLDRPDVMSTYTVKIVADKTKYPVLLSNGNLIESADLENGKHTATWQDPHHKPCYLFALVAGDLGHISDSFKTCGGRDVALKIYVDKGNEGRCAWAMDSLIRSMKWDEDVFGLEYDLDIFNIVAVDHFNFGAMENKSLNIFNSRAVLADPETATDANFESIEGIVAHEYFHNWTGNRVTCRDWFQLTLKEGLTVFRDCEFSSDANNRDVFRIENVAYLRNYQYSEDSGPMAHPIRPEAYIEMDNFYTHTVYVKGAEVIGMVHTLIGKENFRKGMDRYFELFDGQAVTCDDFIRAMQDGSGFDFTQFKNWYSQSGTPVVTTKGSWNEKAKTYTLNVKQNDPGNFLFPLIVGLVNKRGDDVQKEKILVVSKPEEDFVFENITEEVIPSINRQFSAPIKLVSDHSQEDLVFLYANDNDAFNQYEAGQRLATACLESLIAQYQNKEELKADTRFIDALGSVLKNKDLEPSILSTLLSLPSVNILIEEMDICDFDAAREARDFLKKEIATAHRSNFESIYSDMTDSEYKIEALAFGRRKLKMRCLDYLMSIDDGEAQTIVLAQYKGADNMTDEIAALQHLCDSESSERETSIKSFYDKWKENNLVMIKWFSAQASSERDDTLERVKALQKDPAFDSKNPNNVRSVIGGFAYNIKHFHDISGSGYRYIADQIIALDKDNPSLGAGLCGHFNKCAKMDSVRKELMITELQKILALEKLSKAVFEVAKNALESATKTKENKSSS